MKPRTIWTLLLAWLLALPATATVLLPLTVDDLSRLAPLVLVGEVNSVKCEWNQSKTKIYTRVLVTPTEVLKGDKNPGTVTIKTIGGRVGNVVAELAGAPRFSVGERVVVFLEPRRDGDGYNTLGLYQGKFELVRDQKTGQELALRPEAGRGVGFAADAATSKNENVLTLEQIRAAVRRAGGGK
ncbi:MAG: hypothetical protein DRI34_02725 [Deltaproteobacteria bacterium]|nr:MAG: hypothetical protein DRI34_02725 [Deltaproteobacteria bacterium]